MALQNTVTIIAVLARESIEMKYFKRKWTVVIVSSLMIVPALRAAPESPVDKTENTALNQYVYQVGRMAGAARFCQVEEQQMEEFLSITEGRINTLAQNNYERILGKIDFKNYMAAAAGKAPEKGCAVFLQSFRAQLRDPF